MKLYATTTSERASKGQGGQWLKIELKSDKSVLPFAFIDIQEKDDSTIHLSITGNGEVLKNGVFYWIPKEYTKGERQNDFFNRTKTTPQEVIDEYRREKGKRQKGD